MGPENSETFLWLLYICTLSTYTIIIIFNVTKSVLLYAEISCLCVLQVMMLHSFLLIVLCVKLSGKQFACTVFFASLRHAKTDSSGNNFQSCRFWISPAILD